LRRSSFGLEPLITRCSKALSAVKLSPPPPRASPKFRDSPKSVPLASYPEEEVAYLIAHEVELSLCQTEQQPMTQQRHAHPATQHGSHLTLAPSLHPTQTSSLPHPQTRRRRSTLQFNEDNEQRTVSLPRQQSQPYPPPSGRASHRATLMDLDFYDADFSLQEGPVSLRALPGSVLYKPPSQSAASLTLPRGMATSASAPHSHFISQTLPRKFPTIPAIKPILPDPDPITGRPTKNIPIPHIASARRKSLIPDPERETSALYSIDENGVEFVLGGTLPQLVNSLTDERADMEFIEDFLYTYRYFTTPEIFFELLQKRYIYNAPLICTPEERALFDDWRPPVQLRVITVLKKWIEDHFYDFEDSVLLDRLRSFIFATISMENPKWATCLEEIIHSKLICSINFGDRAIIPNGLDSLEVLCALLKQSDLIKNRKWHLKTYRNCFGGQEAVDWMMMHMGLKSRQIVCNLGTRLVANELIHCISKEKNEFRDTAHSFYQFTPKAEEILARVLPATPILPKNAIEMNLANVAAKEIARQLTLIEFDLFKRIKLDEISWQHWSKNNGGKSPHVTAMIDRFNKVGFWVATEIVSQKHHTMRVALLKKLIKIAHICKKINNFNTMMEIAVGLNMGSVSRLSKVWAALDTKTKNRFDEIMKLTHSSQNYKNYREALKAATVPVLPYLALFLRDLTFIEDGNSNHMVAQTEINFLKMRMLAKVFKSITHYQQAASYIFTPVPQLQQYLLQGIVVMNEADLYKLSHQCEHSRESTKLSSSVS